MKTYGEDGRSQKVENKPQQATGDRDAGARISACRTYRYALWRAWAAQLPYCVFIGFNPSTADETEDDPTLRRCIRFAKDWGFGGVVMVNLFAFRATDPKEMMAAEDPVGPENDKWLLRVTFEAKMVVAAWGIKGSYKGRASQVMTRLQTPLFCLGTTKEGYPRHPLYVKANVRPVPLATRSKEGD